MYDIKTPPDFKKESLEDNIEFIKFKAYLKAFREYWHQGNTKPNEKLKK